MLYALSCSETQTEQSGDCGGSEDVQYTVIYWKKKLYIYWMKNLTEKLEVLPKITENKLKL